MGSVGEGSQPALMAVGEAAMEPPAPGADVPIMGNMDPGLRNPNAHKRTQFGKVGSAAGKLINRTQNCHPLLRTDFRERWYGEKSPGAPAPVVQPKSYKVDITHLQRSLAPASRGSPEPQTGMGLHGSADMKVINRTQASHPVLRDDMSYKRYIQHGGAPRGDMLSRAGMGTTPAARSTLRSASALELHRPPPLNVARTPGRGTPSPWQHQHPAIPTAPATAPGEGEAPKVQRLMMARRELCVVPAN